jgi:hypothetical protein
VQFSSGQQCSVPLFARGYSDTPTPRARERRIRVQVRRRAVDMDLGTSLLLGGALFSSPARSQPRSVAPSFFLFFFEIKRESGCNPSPPAYTTMSLPTHGVTRCLHHLCNVRVVVVQSSCTATGRTYEECVCHQAPGAGRAVLAVHLNSMFADHLHTSTLRTPCGIRGAPALAQTPRSPAYVG